MIQIQIQREGAICISVPTSNSGDSPPPVPPVIYARDVGAMSCSVDVQLFLQASGVRSRDQASVSSEPFVRTLRMTRYVFAERVYVWHVFMNYENVSTLVRVLSCDAAPPAPLSRCRKLCHKCSAVAKMGDRLATIDMG